MNNKHRRSLSGHHPDILCPRSCRSSHQNDSLSESDYQEIVQDMIKVFRLLPDRHKQRFLDLLFAEVFPYNDRLAGASLDR